MPDQSTQSGSSGAGGSGGAGGAGGSGTGAGGYNIPFSLSAASTYSVPQNLLAPTYFVFGSAGARVGGDIASGAESYAPATATSSAAQRDSSATTGAQEGALGAIGLPTKYTGIAVVAGLVILGAIYIWKKTH